MSRPALVVEPEFACRTLNPLFADLRVGDFVRVPDRTGIYGTRYAIVKKHVKSHVVLTFWNDEKGGFGAGLNDTQGYDDPVERIEGGTLEMMARIVARGFASDVRKNLESALDLLRKAEFANDAEFDCALDRASEKFRAARKALKGLRE